MAFSASRAVLFDLDGTLADTAPDLVGTLLELRRRRGLGGLDEAELREHATRGAIGLLEAGFKDIDGIEPSELRQEFLDHYADHLWVRSRAFPGVDAALARLADAGLGLGVVTNKVEALAQPVIERAGWIRRFGCLIGGDTLTRSKPDPAPVIEACRRLGVTPSEAVFVGDDRRDVLAGQAAGVRTVVARWGYLPSGEDGTTWGADAVIDRADELDAFLGLPDRASVPGKTRRTYGQR